MIDSRDLMRLVERHRGDAVVIGAQMARYPLTEISRHKEIDIPFAGCMGKGSSLALGIALAQPSRRVILLDGDGSLLMNLGSLVTVANKAPANLYHLVLENGMYAGTGGQPIPGEGRFSFQTLARAAGYRASYSFDDLEELASGFADILDRPGPVLICVKAVPDIETRPVKLRGRRRSPMDALPQVKATLARAS